MPYKYMSAMSYVNDKSPKTVYREGFQALLDEQFYNASDWYTIGEETVRGSSDYYDIDVRINNVVNTETGVLQGDDYKTLLFKEMDHAVELGTMYYFENNYWLVINVQIIASLAATATIKRCNNSLRWVDPDGGYHNVPCSIDYLIKENRNYATAGSALVLPSGFMEVVVQYNSAVNTIRPNNRFLFGNSDNWTAYRVYGGGVGNFNNLDTTNTPGFIRLSMGTDFVNTDSDDLVNGIADYLQNVYTVNITDSSITGQVGNALQLYATVNLNGETVIRTLSWESSDEDIASVDSNGLVTFVGVGACTITCTIENNSLFYDTCTATTSATPVSDYQIVVSPTTNYILEGSIQEFDVYLYKNGVIQADAFVFSLDANAVPSANYIYAVTDPNVFSVENIERFLTDKLEVTCTSGAYSKVIEIYLRGKW